MNRHAFYLSMEVAISLLILTSMVVVMPPAEQHTLNELQVLQKQNDLLKVWVATDCSNYLEMVQDVGFVFPGNCTILEIDGSKFKVNCAGFLMGGENKIASEGFCINALNQFQEIKLTFYY